MQGELIDQLARLNCRLAGRGLEFALVKAQVVTPGPRAAGLAQARAQAVKHWLVTQHGWDAARIVLEPLKGSPAGSVPWVTVEVTPRMYEYQPADCSLLGWQAALLAGNARMAGVVGRSLLRTGWVTDPVRLYETALAQQRGDVADAFDSPDSGIRLTPEQQAQVARLALQHGALTRFQTWLDAQPSQAVAQAADWHVRVCQSKGSEAGRAALIGHLKDLGLPPDARALSCALQEARSAALTQAVLDAGAAHFIDAELTVRAGAQPELLAVLLAHGADPRSRTDLGLTLMHTSRLSSPADLQRLLDLGLDINAPAKTWHSNPVTTPLKEAVQYASPQVLDAMWQAGARLTGMEFAEARGNPLAKLWLHDHGLPLDAAALWVSMAGDGDAAAPALRALHARGAPPAAAVQAALGEAIRVFAPDAVQALLDLGADASAAAPGLSKGTAMTPLMQAQQLVVRPYTCVFQHRGAGGCMPDLQARKLRIVAILQAAGS